MSTIVKDMEKVNNRRKHTRYPWKGMVTYRRSIQQKGLTFKEVSGRGQLQDVSNGGICLITKQRLAPNQLLSLTVPLSYPDPAIPTLAYVRWTRPLRGQARYTAGLSFLI